MKRILRPICWMFDHKYIAQTINGNYSGLEWCGRCGAKWWRGRLQ